MAPIPVDSRGKAESVCDWVEAQSDWYSLGELGYYESSQAAARDVALRVSFAGLQSSP